MLDECWHGCGSYGAVWSCGRCVGTKTHAAITSAMATSSPEDSDLYFVVYGVDYDTNKTDELGQAFVNLEQLYAGGRDLFKEMVPVQDTSGKLLGKLSVTLEAMDAMRSISSLAKSPPPVIDILFQPPPTSSSLHPPAPAPAPPTRADKLAADLARLRGEMLEAGERQDFEAALELQWQMRELQSVGIAPCISPAPPGEATHSICASPRSQAITTCILLHPCPPSN